ncbi:hypothetical protein SNEBB_004608 [Seison nebaliae]|nr:hypothetical protein SNEBB_004608 [Seison nebaliae]
MNSFIFLSCILHYSIISQAQISQETIIEIYSDKRDFRNGKNYNLTLPLTTTGSDGAYNLNQVQVAIDLMDRNIRDYFHTSLASFFLKLFDTKFMIEKYNISMIQSKNIMWQTYGICRRISYFKNELNLVDKKVNCRINLKKTLLVHAKCLLRKNNLITELFLFFYEQIIKELQSYCHGIPFEAFEPKDEFEKLYFTLHIIFNQLVYRQLGNVSLLNEIVKRSHRTLLGKNGLMEWKEKMNINGNIHSPYMATPFFYRIFRRHLTISWSIIVTMYSVTIFCSLSFNLLVVVTLIFTIRRRSATVLHYFRADITSFLLNLAFVDLLVTIFCMPFTVHQIVSERWYFGKVMCKMILFLQLFTVTLSIITLITIGVDRYLAIRYPLKQRLTHRRIWRVILFLWCCAGGFSAIQLFTASSRTITKENRLYNGQIIITEVIMYCNEDWSILSSITREETVELSYSIFLFICTYLLPLIILSITYGSVSKSLTLHVIPGETNERFSRDLRQLENKRKTIRMLQFLVAAFAVCWAPLHLLNIYFRLRQYSPKHFPSLLTTQQYKYLYIACHWLSMANTFINPIIYGIGNRGFRKDMKIMLNRLVESSSRLEQRIAFNCLSNESDNTIIGVREFKKKSTPNHSSPPVYEPSYYTPGNLATLDEQHRDLYFSFAHPSDDNMRSRLRFSTVEPIIITGTVKK